MMFYTNNVKGCMFPDHPFPQSSSK